MSSSRPKEITARIVKRDTAWRGVLTSDRNRVRRDGPDGPRETIGRRCCGSAVGRKLRPEDG